MYVDDILIASIDKIEIKRLKEALSKTFEMKDMGIARKILGMNLVRDRSNGTLLVTPGEYFERIVKRFHMENAKSISTPLAQL